MMCDLLTDPFVEHLRSERQQRIPARRTAEKVVKDAKPRVYGMWYVRQEIKGDEQEKQA